MYFNKKKLSNRNKYSKWPPSFARHEKPLFSKFAIQHIVVSISIIVASVFVLAPQYFEEHPYRQYSWNNSTEKSPKGSDLSYGINISFFVGNKVLNTYFSFNNFFEKNNVSQNNREE